MRLSNPESWQEIFGFDPTNISPVEAKRRIASQIREMCNDLNQRADRRGISQGLRRLSQVGKLLEDHRWLQGEL